MNILFILEDALRPRNMGCYGYPKPTSPNCDRLAAEGVRFETCIAVSAHTFPPIVSLLTGQTTFTHGLVTSQDYARWRGRRAPLHALADNGHLVDGELVMRWSPLGFTRDMNDLDAYLDAHRNHRWFYFAEPYPTHLPYNPPEAYLQHFLDPGYQPSAGTLERAKVVRSCLIVHPSGVISRLESGADDPIPDSDSDPTHKRSVGTVDLLPEDRPYVQALYDGEVRVFDDMVGRWLAKLESLGILDDTLIIVTADHGEELMERGHVGHTSCNLKGTLYDESIHVPLIMRYPKRLPAGTVVRHQVSQVDVMPTIFDLLGLDMPKPCDGSSLLPLIQGQKFREEAYAETPPAGWQALPGDERRIRCVRTAEWKLIIHSGKAERSELYHLTQDPGERHNLINQEPTIAQRLRASLEAHRRQT
jgi:arylsulfatase A-like enzyme